jgi:hypothetical protein
MPGSSYALKHSGIPLADLWQAKKEGLRGPSF